MKDTAHNGESSKAQRTMRRVFVEDEEAPIPAVKAVVQLQKKRRKSHEKHREKKGSKI
jgi:hypothetical protein